MQSLRTLGQLCLQGEARSPTFLFGWWILIYFLHWASCKVSEPQENYWKYPLIFPPGGGSLHYGIFLGPSQACLSVFKNNIEAMLFSLLSFSFPPLTVLTEGIVLGSWKYSMIKDDLLDGRYAQWEFPLILMGDKKKTGSNIGRHLEQGPLICMFRIIFSICCVAFLKSRWMQ